MKIEDKDKKTVVVGLSGGVDSSVSALLLKQQGYNVLGLHMKNGNSESEAEDIKMLNSLCQKIGIECKIVDYENEMQLIKDYFVSEYAAGRTPNPCVMCNKMVKFNPFIKFAESVGAHYYATGHYAKIVRENGKTLIKKAIDQNKDQSYFLNQLSRAQIQKAMFPLGNLTKEEVKQIAEENGLIMANRKESYDVCFLENEKLENYLSGKVKSAEGNIIDINSGKVLKIHTGLSKFTLGQRKGLGIGGGHGKTGEGWFVVKKDIKNNILYVAQGADDSLYSSSLVAKNFNWISGKPNDNNFNCLAKFRFRQADQAVSVNINEDKTVLITFKEKQRAITEGQYAVLYTDDGTMLGGGVIEQVIKS